MGIYTTISAGGIKPLSHYRFSPCSKDLISPSEKDRKEALYKAEKIDQE
jgi:hypothetical protein